MENKLFKKGLSKLFMFFMAFSLLIGAVYINPAEAQVKSETLVNVNINGQNYVFKAVPGIVQGQPMVPVKILVEKLNAKTSWDSKSRSIKINKNSNVLKLTIGSKVAYKNNILLAPTVQPVIVNGSTYIPLLYVTKALGYEVAWNSALKVASIKEKAKANAPVAVAAPPAKKLGGVVNIYTSRHYGVEPVFTEFTKETGIKVRFTTGPDTVLRERLKAEGANTPADVFIAVDAGNLWLAAQDGLLQPIKSDVVLRNIPNNYRDPQSKWVGLTKRARTIMYNSNKVSASELSTYEALGDPKWRGKLILRPATHVYTQSLVAHLIAVNGPEKAEKIVRGWMDNQPTFIDSDSRIIETLAAGGGDVAITNHYYLGRLLEKNPSLPVKAFWANQNAKEGVHVNTSGIGITTHAENKENALALIEWLASPKGQKLFAESNHEYPTNPSVAAHPIIAEFGSFKEDTVFKGEFGRFQADAVKLLEKVGYK